MRMKSKIVPEIEIEYFNVPIALVDSQMFEWVVVFHRAQCSSKLKCNAGSKMAETMTNGWTINENWMQRMQRDYNHSSECLWSITSKNFSHSVGDVYSYTPGSLCSLLCIPLHRHRYHRPTITRLKCYFPFYFFFVLSFFISWPRKEKFHEQK